jgi:hypothetical protein
MPLIPWAVGLTASRPSENGTSMTSPLHSDPSWHSVFPQSPKKIQENLKQTGSPGRRDRTPYGGAVMHQLRPLGTVAAATIALALIAGGVAVEFATRAASVDSCSAIGVKPAPMGPFAASCTDSDGMPYNAAQIVESYLAPSGAFELDRNNGKRVDVGQIIDDILAVANTTKGRTVILVMSINPDGSLSGRWTRSTHRAVLGTEIWTHMAD